VGRRIVIGEYALGLEVRKLLIALVAQEQRLATVADEHKRIVGNLQFAHIAAPRLNSIERKIQGERRAKVDESQISTIRRPPEPSFLIQVN
jgi:hypothetical protein